MLDHVRRIDDIDGCAGVRDAPGIIGIADAEAPAIGNERDVARVDQAGYRRSAASTRERASSTAGELS